MSERLTEAEREILMAYPAATVRIEKENEEGRTSNPVMRFDPKSPRVFKTTKFSLYLRDDDSSGTIFVTDERHKLSMGLGPHSFRHLDEIPGKIRMLLKKVKMRCREKQKEG